MKKISLIPILFVLGGFSACLEQKQTQDPLASVQGDCRKELDQYYLAICKESEEHAVCQRFLQLFENFQMPDGKPICQPRIFSRMLHGLNMSWEQIVSRRVEKGEDVSDQIQKDFNLANMDRYTHLILKGAKPKPGKESTAEALRNSYQPFESSAPDAHVESHRAQQEKLKKEMQGEEHQH